MKRCPNPNCGSAIVYGNDRTACPFCHSRLLDIAAEMEAPDGTILPPDSVTIRDAGKEADMRETAFILRSPRRIMCHGRVTEIDHHEVFNSRYYKLFNSLLRGEPYQFAHQTIEYTIRMENISEGVPTKMTDFCLFGSYLGRLQVGDEVIVHARDLNNRRIVKAIYNETTDTVIKPGLQIPAGVIRGVFLATAIALIIMISSIVWVFKAGITTVGLKAVLVVLAQTVFIIIWICIVKRIIFPGKRRR